jgi:hypothetical protein
MPILSSSKRTTEIVDILIDVSESMGQNPLGKTPKTGEPTKMDIAKYLLQNLITANLGETAEWGLKYFGGACQPVRVVEPGRRKADDVKKCVSKLPPPNGRTPLAAALRMSFGDLSAHKNPKKIFVISDGKEECEPWDAVDEISKRIKAYNIKQTRYSPSAFGRTGYPLRVFPVPVGRIDQQASAQLKTLADDSGGKVISAPDGDWQSLGSQNDLKAVVTTQEPQTFADASRRISRSVLLAIFVQVLGLAVLCYVLLAQFKSLDNKVDIQADAIKTLSEAVKALADKK